MEEKTFVRNFIAIMLLITTVLVIWLAGQGVKKQTPKNSNPPKRQNMPSFRISFNYSSHDSVNDLMIPVGKFIKNNTLIDVSNLDQFDELNPIMSINPVNKDLFNDYKILYNSFYNCYKGMAERRKSFDKQTKKQKETNLAIEVLEYVKQLNKFYASLELTTNKLLDFESNEKLKVQEVVANYLFGFNLSLLMGFMVLRNKELVFVEERLKSNKSLNDLTQHYLKEMEELSKEAYADKKEIEIINGKQAEIHWVKDYDKFLKLARNVIGLLYLTVFTINDELNVNGIWRPVSVVLKANLESGDKAIQTMIDEKCVSILVEMDKRYTNDKGIENEISKECFDELVEVANNSLEKLYNEDR